MRKHETISYYAMCRECAKEFGTEEDFCRMYQHVKDFPGHVIIGTEQNRFIIKGPVCTAH